MISVLLLSAVFGAVIGSFLSVCIYRIPFHKSVGLLQDLKEQASAEENALEEYVPAHALRHAELSINSPQRSECLDCGHQLSWWQNIPILSFILLLGKCHFCKAKISARYPLVELTSTLMALLSVVQFGFTIAALVTFIVCATFLVIALIDYDWYIIPDIISYPSAGIAILLVAINQFFPYLPAPYAANLTQAALGILCGAGFLWSVAFLYLKIRKQEGLGFGDVKLLVVIGALFGPGGAFFTIFMGSVLGTIGGVAMILMRGRSMAHPLPFGPFLLAATVVYIFMPRFVFGESFLGEPFFSGIFFSDPLFSAVLNTTFSFSMLQL